MIKFKFSISLIDDEISAFEQGDMEIHQNDSVISSCNKVPDQSMMIFVSLSDLLDSVYKVILGGHNKIKFIGTDSSFSIDIGKEGKLLYIGNAEVKMFVNHKELASSLYNEAYAFYMLYRKKLEENSYFDLRDSLSNFKSNCLN
ncbi:hypothetical protein MTX78_19000 [Hymenobacter tibetensis]|uniref:Uncharacterized protein n=1 Tax=Hymenobacter tibetensis TaxID=497967 RepID=A0ABY4CVX6_9BACT|nr:hypothetical protein [Hymenobacter tibetensis]UOG74197.1 hypothetical protein MTX78_19000 [Hymenobacter tibetensis]